MTGNYYELFGMNNSTDIETSSLNAKVKRYRYSNSGYSYEILDSASEEDKINTEGLDSEESIFPLYYKSP